MLYLAVTRGSCFFPPNNGMATYALYVCMCMCECIIHNNKHKNELILYIHTSKECH